MRPESRRFPVRSALFAPTGEVCLGPVFWSDFILFRPPCSVPALIFLDTIPAIRAAWMGQMRPG